MVLCPITQVSVAVSQQILEVDRGLNIAKRMTVYKALGVLRWNGRSTIRYYKPSLIHASLK